MQSHYKLFSCKQVKIDGWMIVMTAVGVLLKLRDNDKADSKTIRIFSY